MDGRFMPNITLTPIVVLLEHDLNHLKYQRGCLNQVQIVNSLSRIMANVE